MPDASTFNCWSHKEVTVYIFWCLAKINTLTVLLLSFEVVWDLTFFDLWYLFRRSDEEVTVDFFDVWPRLTHWQCYFYHFTLFAIWPFLTFDLLTIGQVKRSPWTCFDVWPRLTHWQCYFYHFTLFAIWPFLTFDPLTIGEVKRSPWTLFDVWPRPTLWRC